jgi:hypothetical protein
MTYIPARFVFIGNPGLKERVKRHASANRLDAGA